MMIIVRATRTDIIDHRSDSSMSEEQDQMTLKPFKSPEPPLKLSAAIRPRVEASASRAIPSSSTVEDYSDIGIDVSETELESKLANLKVRLCEPLPKGLDADNPDQR